MNTFCIECDTRSVGRPIYCYLFRLPQDPLDTKGFESVSWSEVKRKEELVQRGEDDTNFSLDIC